MSQRNDPRYPRTARVNELVREIVADELAELDDSRLDLVAVTQVAVDRDLHQAVVYYDSLTGAEADDEVQAALGEHRVRLQAAIGRQARLRRTPHLVFRADDVERGAARIEGILRDLSDDHPE
jgi:ribosome-binding factor A